jgi:hypothetical protein
MVMVPLVTKPYITGMVEKWNNGIMALKSIFPF